MDHTMPAGVADPLRRRVLTASAMAVASLSFGAMAAPLKGAAPNQQKTFRRRK